MKPAVIMAAVTVTKSMRSCDTLVGTKAMMRADDSGYKSFAAKGGLRRALSMGERLQKEGRSQYHTYAGIFKARCGSDRIVLRRGAGRPIMRCVQRNFSLLIPGRRMIFELYLGGLTAVALFIYLVYALIHPDKF